MVRIQVIRTFLCLPSPLCKLQERQRTNTWLHFILPSFYTFNPFHRLNQTRGKLIGNHLYRLVTGLLRCAFTLALVLGNTQCKEEKGATSALRRKPLGGEISTTTREKIDRAAMGESKPESGRASVQFPASATPGPLATGSILPGSGGYCSAVYVQVRPQVSLTFSRVA